MSNIENRERMAENSSESAPVTSPQAINQAPIPSEEKSIIQNIPPTEITFVNQNELTQPEISTISGAISSFDAMRNFGKIESSTYPTGQLTGQATGELTGQITSQRDQKKDPVWQDDTESYPKMQLTSYIEPGKNGIQLVEWAKERLDNLEEEQNKVLEPGETGRVITAEDILSYVKAVDDYELRDPRPALRMKHNDDGDLVRETKRDLINRITTEIQIRIMLTSTAKELQAYNYEPASALIREYFKPGQLRFLWNETWGLNDPDKEPDPENMLVRKFVRIMEEPLYELDSSGNKVPIEGTEGVYWREARNKEIVVLGIRRRVYGDDSKHAEGSRIVNETVTRAVNEAIAKAKMRGLSDEEAKREAESVREQVTNTCIKVREVTENLNKVLGMAAFYTGPMDRSGRVLDVMLTKQLKRDIDRTDIDRTKLVIPYMKEDPTPPHLDDWEYRFQHPEVYFTKNPAYWEKWWEMRKNFDSKPRFLTSDGGRSGLRRLIYAPEEFDTDPKVKAKHLTNASELYIRPYPIKEGTTSTEEFMEKVATYGSFAIPYYYANDIHGAGEVQKLMSNILILSPLVYEQVNTGAKVDLAKALDNIIKVPGKFYGYLEKGDTPNNLYLGTSRFLVETLNYLNVHPFPDDKMDRYWGLPVKRAILEELQHNFPKMPYITKLSMFNIITNSYFHPFLQADTLKWTLDSVDTGKSVWVINELVQSVTGTLGKAAPIAGRFILFEQAG